MYAAVYRLREHGVKLPKPKDAVVGELRLRPHQVGTNDPQALLAELMLVGGVALPPLHVAVVRHITQGGMVINADAQVLHEDGHVIEGLYAIGNCSAPTLPCYPGPGSTLGPAMTFAYQAAKSITGYRD